MGLPTMIKTIWRVLALLVIPFSVIMAENRIDTIRPDAPALAAYGAYTVGVRPVQVSNPDQIDIVNIDPAAEVPDPLPTYDRSLSLEIWYPASEYATGNQTIRAFMRDGRTEIDLQGQGIVWAAAKSSDGPYPLVIISHGYPGNRFLLSHLAENLASKGYVVASIDHTDSTYRDLNAFGSTLVNRPLDQLFVLNQMAALSADDSHFLYGMVDASNAAIIGYSMGAYGAVISSGGGVSQVAIDAPFGAPHGLLGVNKSGSDTHNALIDPRIKTSVAFAPWGMQLGFFDVDGLANINIPMLFVAGSVDDVSGYEAGTRALWEKAVNTDRALLTFDNANHNAGAPYPSPEEGYEFDPVLGFAAFEHYADAVWDTARMNNVSQHHITAWLGKYLKGDSDMDEYLDLIPNSNDGVYDIEEGEPTDDHTYWAGYPSENYLRTICAAAVVTQHVSRVGNVHVFITYKESFSEYQWQLVHFLILMKPYSIAQCRLPHLLIGKYVAC